MKKWDWLHEQRDPNRRPTSSKEDTAVMWVMIATMLAIYAAVFFEIIPL